MCDEWLNDVTAFYNYIGPKPTPKHTLDRIDNNGNYEPGNVRWATRSEQLLNQRTRSTAEILELGCFYGTINDWAKALNLVRQTLYFRRNEGWLPYEIIYGKVRAPLTRSKK